MIYGDPFLFALQFETVEAWTEENDIWKNGLFCFYLDGKRLFDVVDVFELKTTTACYLNIDINNLKINSYPAEAREVFKSTWDYLFGDGEELMDGVVDLTCTAMLDSDCSVYVLLTDEHDRFVWSKNDGKTVNENRLPPGTVVSVIKELKNTLLGDPPSAER